ncbi:MAG: four helix bundle protein [Flavobacteriales bacterium]|nr:four helix bundle protein [Flavobacteriales bacterium]MCB9193140.1 four helix bundle protein [Flavobacteriales bacterium]
MEERGKEQVRPHKDLKDRTMQFALANIHLFKGLPRTVEAQVMGKQLLRAATSVGAHTRSAFRGRSKKEYVAKLGVVIEEADECGYWLELLCASETVETSFIEHLVKESDELVSIFTSLVKR